MAAVGRHCFIGDMNYTLRQRLIQVLDLDGAWKKLAAELHRTGEVKEFDTLWILLLQQRQWGSPTETLLIQWSHRNPTVDELESILRSLNLIRAADILRNVDGAGRDNGCNRPGTGQPGAGQDYREPDNNTPFSRVLYRELDDTGLPLPSLPDQATIAGPIGRPAPIHVQASNRMNIRHPIENSTAWTNMMPKGGSCTTDMTRSDNNTSSRVSDAGSVNFNRPGVSPSNKPVFMSDVRGSPSAKTFDRAGADDEKLRGIEVSGPPEIESLFQYVPRFLYSDIFTATNKFSSEFEIGHGGFGEVYLADIRSMKLAVKVLKESAGSKFSADFIRELHALIKMRHKNIITLVGCSVDGPRVCLVYEFMVNGSLRDRLDCRSGKRALSWQTRQQILRDAATGLHFLHNVQERPLIHADIKSANILLGPNFEAKISDFGLAKEATGGTQVDQFTHITHRVNDTAYGTKPYLPAFFFLSLEYGTKTDVFALGVVIFETCTGEKPYDVGRKGGRLLLEYILASVSAGAESEIRIRDPRAHDWPVDLWRKLFLIGLMCAKNTKREIPHMKQVLPAIENLLKLTTEYDRSAAPFGVHQPTKPPGCIVPSDPFRHDPPHRAPNLPLLPPSSTAIPPPLRDTQGIHTDAFLDFDDRKFAEPPGLGGAIFVPLNGGSVHRSEAGGAGDVSPVFSSVGGNRSVTLALTQVLHVQRRSIDGLDEPALIADLHRDDPSGLSQQPLAPPGPPSLAQPLAPPQSKRSPQQSTDRCELDCTSSEVESRLQRMGLVGSGDSSTTDNSGDFPGDTSFTGTEDGDMSGEGTDAGTDAGMSDNWTSYNNSVDDGNVERRLRNYSGFSDASFPPEGKFDAKGAGNAAGVRQVRNSDMVDTADLLRLKNKDLPEFFVKIQSQTDEEDALLEGGGSATAETTLGDQNPAAESKLNLGLSNLDLDVAVGQGVEGTRGFLVIGSKAEVGFRKEEGLGVGLAVGSDAGLCKGSENISPGMVRLTSSAVTNDTQAGSTPALTAASSGIGLDSAVASPVVITAATEPTQSPGIGSATGSGIGSSSGPTNPSSVSLASRINQFGVQSGIHVNPEKVLSGTSEHGSGYSTVGSGGSGSGGSGSGGSGSGGRLCIAEEDLRRAEEVKRLKNQRMLRQPRLQQ